MTDPTIDDIRMVAQELQRVSEASKSEARWDCELEDGSALSLRARDGGTCSLEADKREADDPTTADGLAEVFERGDTLAPAPPPEPDVPALPAPAQEKRAQAGQLWPPQGRP